MNTRIKRSGKGLKVTVSGQGRETEKGEQDSDKNGRSWAQEVEKDETETELKRWG